MRANGPNLKLAEKEARVVGALLAAKRFSWEPYQRKSSARETVGDWIQRFEKDYFQRRSRSPKTETTWRYDYQKVFSKLPQEELLTVELLRNVIKETTPDTRTRKRFVDVLTRFSKFAGLDVDFSSLKGTYSPKKVSPRDLPTDEKIAECFHALPDGTWKWAYGVMAVYGLRNHEIFYLDLSRFTL